MIYLLDTHALWHHASDGGEFNVLAATRLDEARLEDLCVLDVSLYELARHMALGRIEVADPLAKLATIESSYPILRSNYRKVLFSFLVPAPDLADNANC